MSLDEEVVAKLFENGLHYDILDSNNEGVHSDDYEQVIDNLSKEDMSKLLKNIYSSFSW